MEGRQPKQERSTIATISTSTGNQRMTDNLPANTAPKGIAIEDLIEYRSKGLTMEEIAKLTGCDHSNVARRLKEAELETLDNFQTHKDKAFEHLQRKALKNITDDEIKRLNPLQRVTAAAILQDKIMALRGQASEIIDHRHLVVNLDKAIDALMRERGQEQIIDAEPSDAV